MDTQEFKYTIGDKVYKQTPLVLGQIQQLTNLIKNLELPTEITPLSLITSLGDKLPTAIAIVLKDPNIPLKNKDLGTFADEIMFELSTEDTLQVIEDFFSCNQISSLLEKINGTVIKITESLNQTKKETGSQTP